MKRSILFGMLTFFTLISGCIFDSDNDKKSDAVKKGSVSGTVVMTITKDPVANVKVYLIDKATKIETVNQGSIRKAFVDSATTDANGKYVIDGISPGNYFVAPVDANNTNVYRFTTAAESDSTGFAMNGDSRQVNFIAEKTDYPGLTEHDMCGINIEFLNMDRYDVLEAAYTRKCWLLFIPGRTDRTPIDILHHVSSDIPYIGQSFYKGYTCVFFTLENIFYIELIYQKKGELRDKTVTFEISFPFGSATYGDYTYDAISGELKETGRTTY